MGFLDGSEEQELHDRYHDPENKPEHKPKITHELLGGAAAFYAAKKYEEHVAENGTPPTHARAKELLAGFAGAFLDREIESKGLDFIDRKKAEHEAKKRAEQGYDAAYNSNDVGYSNNDH